MEADWEFELGGDAPVIEAQWSGFIDLRQNPERAWQLPETAQLPALAQALARLNAPASPVWTSKCDFWPHLEAGEFDADELDAPPGCDPHAMGCYIDILPKSGQQWPLPTNAATACKCACNLLRDVLLCCCRVDLVIRRAIVAPEIEGLGITAYLSSCGENEGEAAIALQASLTAFAGALCGHSTVE
jgi:hypothetical protein